MLLEHNQVIFNDIKENIDKINNFCIVQGTGTGKSFLFFESIQELFQNKKILFVIPKNEIENNMREYPEFAPLQEYITFKSYKWFEDQNHIQNAYETYDVIFVDEVHHIGSKLSGTNLRKLLQKVKKNHNKYFVGLTATPIRDCDKTDVTKFFDYTYYGYSTFECIEQGLMPQIEYLVCDKDNAEILMDENYKEELSFKDSEEFLRDIIKNNPKNKWICFFSNKKQLKELTGLIESLFPDHKIFEIYESSKDTIKDIKKEDKVVILSIDKLLEGIHLDKMEGILLFRQVHSLTVFSQILGRVTAIGQKTNPLVIDCTKTSIKLLAKMLEKHGNIVPRKTGEEKKGEEKKLPVVKVSLKNKRYFNIQNMLRLMESNCFSKNSFLFHGKEYDSIAACCRDLNIPVNAIILRAFSKKITHEKAIEEYLDSMFCYEGKGYPSVKKCCEEYHICYSTVQQKHKRENISYQEAISVCRKGFGYTYNGNTYSSFKQCCISLGINYRTAQTHVNNGLSREKAIERVILYKHNNFVFRNESFSSKKECLKHYNITKRQFYNAYTRFKNHTEALEYILSKREPAS